MSGQGLDVRTEKKMDSGKRLNFRTKCPDKKGAEMSGHSKKIYCKKFHQFGWKKVNEIIFRLLLLFLRRSTSSKWETTILQPNQGPTWSCDRWQCFSWHWRVSSVAGIPKWSLASSAWKWDSKKKKQERKWQKMQTKNRKFRFFLSPPVKRILMWRARMPALYVDIAPGWQNAYSKTRIMTQNKISNSNFRSKNPGKKNISE